MTDPDGYGYWWSTHPWQLAIGNWQLTICNLELVIYICLFWIVFCFLAISKKVMTEDGAIVICRMCGSPVSISIRICHDLSRSVKIYLGHVGPIMINNVQQRIYRKNLISKTGHQLRNMIWWGAATTRSLWMGAVVNLIMCSRTTALSQDCSIPGVFLGRRIAYKGEGAGWRLVPMLSFGIRVVKKTGWMGGWWEEKKRK